MFRGRLRGISASTRLCRTDTAWKKVLLRLSKILVLPQFSHTLTVACIHRIRMQIWTTAKHQSLSFKPLMNSVPSMTAVQQSTILLLQLSIAMKALLVKVRQKFFQLISKPTRAPYLFLLHTMLAAPP